MKNTWWNSVDKGESGFGGEEEEVEDEVCWFSLPSFRPRPPTELDKKGS